jgi:hypothetical protein
VNDVDEGGDALEALPRYSTQLDLKRIERIVRWSSASGTQPSRKGIWSSERR